MSDKQTPLMKQYNQIKLNYPETVLLFRMGDFFETFDSDAVITSKVCGIILTKRNNGAGGETPLAGFPHHQLDNYLPKLVKAGYRVAVCEQLEDPKLAKGIVKRGVIEVVTPGVASYDKLLESKANNYIAGIYLSGGKYLKKLCGVAIADYSTGEFQVCEVALTDLKDLLALISPAEIIISKEQKNEILPELEKLNLNALITKREDWIFEFDFARDILLKHFRTHNLKGFGIEDFTLGISAAGCILNYINETQQGNNSHIRNISLFDTGRYMSLDPATRQNLEITFSQSGDGSLLKIIDSTKSPMGGRLFRKWLNMPLTNLDEIIGRQYCVEVLFNNNLIRTELRGLLASLVDFDRLITKISSGKANPRDLASLNKSLQLIPEINNILSKLESSRFNRLISELNPLSELTDNISNSLNSEPAIQFGNGNIFLDGFNEELDLYVAAKNNGTEWVRNFQNTEREKTGINTLKVGFNNVFGYYIEITKSQLTKAPDHFERRQTLTNAERYTTVELKEIEAKILGAGEKIYEIEMLLFENLRSTIAQFTNEIQQNSNIIAIIDCYQSLAESAVENNYIKPELNDSGIIDITEGRHPVVEKRLPAGVKFTPNDTILNIQNEQLHIITGPNMAGKSCYLRQVAIITLMAQIGSFVPAKKASIGIVDKIFTRLGAHDNILAGESTFLVEMQEAANILNNATEKSLILLDEVGRGTATLDGISIAWAISEYIHNTIKARTLFATHYHELNSLAERYERILNFRVEVIETGTDIIFSHKVTKGSCDNSFGIHVAKMAGLPYEVIERADDIMHTIENEISADGPRTPNKTNTKLIKSKEHPKNDGQLAIFEIRDDSLRQKLISVNLNTITPIQAFNLLEQLKKEAEK